MDLSSASGSLEAFDSVIRHSPDFLVNSIIVEIKLAIHSN